MVAIKNYKLLTTVWTKIYDQSFEFKMSQKILKGSLTQIFINNNLDDIKIIKENVEKGIISKDKENWIYSERMLKQFKFMSEKLKSQR